MENERKPTAAVIDMGTNVFGMLLAECGRGVPGFLEVQKEPVRLGDGGLAGGRLSPRAFDAAFRAFERFSARIRESGGIRHIAAFATSGLREAANGPELADRLTERFGIGVEIISGEREAGLIAKGILASRPVEKAPVLLMDIGGGSNEFIVAEAGRIRWKRSFPLGMARLVERFALSDPVRPEEMKALHDYCWECLQPLREVLDRFRPGRLIGSSGSFDTFRDLLFPERAGIRLGHPDFHPSADLPGDAMDRLSARLEGLDRAGRLAMPGMSEVRVDFIVPAAGFTALVREMLPPGTPVSQSSFSLKEGAMLELGETIGPEENRKEQ